MDGINIRKPFRVSKCPCGRRLYGGKLYKFISNAVNGS